MGDKKYIGFEMKKLTNIMRRKMELAMQDVEVDKTTYTHGWVLGYLVKNEDKEIFQKDFERDFSIRRSTATNMLKLMEQNELIVRIPVPQDARLKRIVLTPKGKRIHEELTELIQKIEDEMEEALTPEEVDTFLELTAKIRRHIESKEF